MPTIQGRAVARAPHKAVSLNRNQLALAIATALAFPISLQTANAQNAPPDELEQITVTGSRIVRRDYEANSPIQTIDRNAFEQQNSIALETALNELPQFVPAGASPIEWRPATASIARRSTGALIECQTEPMPSSPPPCR